MTILDNLLRYYESPEGIATDQEMIDLGATTVDIDILKDAGMLFARMIDGGYVTDDEARILTMIVCGHVTNRIIERQRKVQ